MGVKRDYLPAVAMVTVQVGFAGLNIVSKLALDTGMNPFVMVAYRQVIATVFLAPFAFFYERKTRMKMTATILFQIFLCSVFGATLNQLLYFVGLKLSTPTIACALSNTLPAITFVMAIPFRMETVELGSLAGSAKVVGTVLCVGGSMLMTFYKGMLLRLPQSSIHWHYAEELTGGVTSASSNGDKMVLGSMLVVASCVSWAVWFIVQAKMSESFASPYTSTALMSLMASVECMAVGAAVERKAAGWAVGWDIRLAAAFYTGVVGSGIAFGLMSWCIQRRGPLYVSMFSPLLLVIVAVLGWAILDEKIYVGSVVGSALIVGGLYMVLWGKGRELLRSRSDVEKSMDEEREMDFPSRSPRMTSLV
ncbi:nodulin MtN21 /EamA-like transporter family protein [Wolffia australiana]